MNRRVLVDADHPALESFLQRHRDSSMFLRANARRAGLAYRGEPFQAVYMADFEASGITGIVAHAWNGMVLVQSSDGVEDLAREAVRVSGRPVTGFAGPVDQVMRARTALGMSQVAVAKDENEGLYGLDLDELIVPAPLRDGTVTCRPPMAGDREILHRWRFDYSIETLGSPDSDETRRHAADTIDRQIAEGNIWVAVQENRPVSLSAFNAALPDIVQLGGIYTPPDLRGQGYARVSVAGSLLAARDRGATRSVLFTANPAAARSYEAVGFRRVGTYGLVLLSQAR